MAKVNVNRIQILYNAQDPPYKYGAVHIVDGCKDNQWWERPFVVSKRTHSGEEIVYGTVKRTLEKIVSQLLRLEKFSEETAAMLKTEGINSSHNRENSVLPDSKVTQRIFDEQDNLVEDVLLTVSVNIRILSELFPNKLRNGKVNVYNYDGETVSMIELSKIADLLVHNRYIVIKDHYVMDLISDRQFMNDTPQMGLKVDFYEYISEVEKIVYGLTVKDLITNLREITRKLSPSSSIKDIVFLTQNLYTLGDAMVGTDIKVDSGPLKAVLDKVARKHLERVLPKHPNSDGMSIPIALKFSTPRFYLEPDLAQKQIRTEVNVNDSPEKLVMGYEDFFLEVSSASGGRKLYIRRGR